MLRYEQKQGRRHLQNPGIQPGDGVRCGFADTVPESVSRGRVAAGEFVRQFGNVDPLTRLEDC